MRAIDVHTHPQTEEFLAAMGRRRGQMGSHFGKERTPISFAAQADMYRERDMMAVIVNSAGAPALNDALGKAASSHPDVFIPFCGIDPLKEGAIEEIRRCHGEYNIKGVGELNPGRQHFHPNSPEFYPIWEVCQELGLAVMFHGGFLGAGAGTPGGMGYKLEYAKPIPYLDDVAADFPAMNVIAAHPAWPWHLDNLAACWHKSNYYIDLSGWAPRYWPAEVVHYANSIITKRVLFGTDWPVLDADRWMKEFTEMDFKETSRQRILLDNARELFGIG